MYALRSILINKSKELDDILLETWKETLDQTTQWLWDAVMGELISVLKEHSDSATIIPVGQLTLLPLHAAWTKMDTFEPAQRRYVLDEMKISYAPSAYALWQASTGAKRPAEKLLAIENPDGSLVFSRDEVNAASDVFKQATRFTGKMATVVMVKEEIQKAHVLLFSTHGRAGWEKTRRSCAPAGCAAS